MALAAKTWCLGRKSKHQHVANQKTFLSSFCLFVFENCRNHDYHGTQGCSGLISTLTFVSLQEVIDGGYEIAGKLQDMELTDQEYAMVVAVCIIKPGAEPIVLVAFDLYLNRREAQEFWLRLQRWIFCYNWYRACYRGVRDGRREGEVLDDPQPHVLSTGAAAVSPREQLRRAARARGGARLHPHVPRQARQVQRGVGRHVQAEPAHPLAALYLGLARHAC